MAPKRSKQSLFPAARIKRIMQQDDDVGKVAGASPLVMSKATELFLQEMVQAIEKEARSKSTKKMTMQHVKRAVQSTPSLDFLKELVSSIPDPTGEEDGDQDYAGSKARPKKSRAKKIAATPTSPGGVDEPGSSGGATAKNGAGRMGATTTQMSGHPSVLNHTFSASPSTAPSSSTATLNNDAYAPLEDSIPQPSRKVAIPISSLLGPSESDADEVEEEEDIFSDEGEAPDQLAVKEQEVLPQMNEAAQIQLTAHQPKQPTQIAARPPEDEDYD